ncbi:adenosine deaminase-like isoform X2 [Octopus vulgaris]|uniref:Adenosine deaminase n=1 Tax=Octopus vulgaris TaxID=6645 RepID=A0AA36F074_OCTVU|nr:adenosine deaminase-like isoform X2 [Octopus vulgaris]CAI9719632.1 adenosine deaminase-like isoform X2 [Octopus vulgaris]
MDSNNFPAKVELHVHLDGAIRPETLFETAKRRNIELKEKTVEELRERVTESKNEGLGAMLDIFGYFLPIIKGDKQAIAQIAKDFCEDSAKQNIYYAEVRFAPHILADENLSARDVVKIVLDALKTSCAEHKIIIKAILCCMRNIPEIAKDVLQLCNEFKNDGVVGIDVAGAEFFPTPPEIRDVFKEAHKLGIHRTAHAGEIGGPPNVKEAVDDMFAERVGHGYHVIEDDHLYKQIRNDNIHLETCLVSSFRTQAFLEEIQNHPVTTFLKDDANFSLNTDDPTVFATCLHNEYAMAEKAGFSKDQIIKTIFNAARSSFLPQAEQNDLLNHLKQIYPGDY